MKFDFGEKHLVRLPKARRAINVVVTGVAANSHQKWMALDRMIERAAKIANTKGWKTIILETGEIDPDRLYATNQDGFLANHGFSKNTIFLGRLSAS